MKMPESENPNPAPESNNEDIQLYFRPDEIPERPRRVRHGVHGTARLANRTDMRPFLEPGTKNPEERDRDRRPTRLRMVTPLLEKDHEGGLLEPLLWQTLYMPDELRNRHILGVGQTGSGKTTKLILPLLDSDLSDARRSVIALDAKGRKLYPIVEQLANQYRPGQVIHRLNFRDPERSLIWNPIEGIHTLGDAHEIAHKLCTLVDHGGYKDGVFWLNNSIDLLTGLILALNDDPHEQHSLARARELLQQPLEDFARFVDRHQNNPVLRRLTDFRNRVNTTGECIVQDLLMRLSTFMDDKVAATTSGVSQLDIEELLRSGGILIIEVQETDVGKLQPVLNLLTNRLFTHLIHMATDSVTGRLPRPVSLLIDEFASAVGRMDEIDQRLNTVRERGVSVTAAVQSLSQLDLVYGKAADPVLAGFATKIFFGDGLDLRDAEYASRLTGMTTVEQVTIQQEIDPAADSGFRTMFRTITPVGRRLLLPEEIARPPMHHLFGAPVSVFLPSLTFQAYLTAAHEMPHIAKAMENVAPERLPPLQRRIGELKTKLSWVRASQTAKNWWEACETQLTPDVLITLLEELVRQREIWNKLRTRSATLFDEFMAAASQSATADPLANLAYFQYCLHKRHAEERNAANEMGQGTV